MKDHPPPPTATPAACREAADVLLLGAIPGDATTRARVDRHTTHCAACQAIRARLEQTRDDLQASTPPLDDVRRARMLARLEPALDELAARAAGERARRLGWIAGPSPRRWVTAAAAIGVAAGLVVTVGLLRPRPAPVVMTAAAPALTVTVTAPPIGAAPPQAPVAAAPPSLIQPYRVFARRGSLDASALVNQRFQHLRTMSGTKVRARVGERTRMTMVGPGDVSVQAATPDVLDLSLEAGTLVADFDHRGGGRLRIHSPNAVTEVTGTLFSVEATAGQSRISVAHGRVIVQPANGAPQVVSAGESWLTGTPAPRPVPAATATLLADHDAATQPAPRPATPAGALPATATTTAAASIAPAAPSSDLAFRPAPPAPIMTPPARAAVTVALAGTPRPTAAGAAAPIASPSPLPSPADIPAAPTADRLYADAEQAMRRRDWAGAQRALEQVVATGAARPLSDVARYELAQLAVRAGDEPRASRWLDALLASDREPALREPARLLRCEVWARAGDATAARRCLQTFRAAYSGSARDALALGWLLRLTAARPPCTTIRPLADEYLQRYPGGVDAALAQQRKAQCVP